MLKTLLLHKTTLADLIVHPSRGVGEHKWVIDTAYVANPSDYQSFTPVVQLKALLIFLRSKTIACVDTDSCAWPVSLFVSVANAMREDNFASHLVLVLNGPPTVTRSAQEVRVLHRT